ncbi:MAG: HxsD-like protein [Archangium sp.]|nr:HxsD-like protein [Archangium sp.]
MTRLAFHKSLYAGTAVDEAVKTFAPHATFELSETESAWVVQLSAAEPRKELRVARELGNFALGLTVQNRKAAA